jgi:hypothetical protein
VSPVDPQKGLLHMKMLSVCVHGEWLLLLRFAVADVSKDTYNLCLTLNVPPQKVDII